MADPQTTTGSLPNTANKAGAEASASGFKAPSATPQTTHRAKELMRIAAKFIRQHAVDRTMFYDEATCDGYCLAGELEAEADDN